MSLRRGVARLLALVRRRRLDRELEAEIQAHLELAERDAREAGTPPDEARRQAHLRFGAVDQVRESHRDRRSARWIEHAVRDIRYAVRSFARGPASAAVVIGVLALGIGANAAMFSLVDAVLLRALPFPDPDRLVALWHQPRPGVTNAVSTLDYLDWRRLNATFDALAAGQSVSMALTGRDEPLRLAGKAVSANYFDVFGAAVMEGRTFERGDDEPGSDPVVILSHRTWLTAFGGDPDILTRRIPLDGRQYRVIGVLAPGALDRDAAKFWIPLVFTAEQRSRDWHWLTVFGRLRPGISLEQAQGDMDRVSAALADVTPVFKKNWTIAIRPFGDLLVTDRLRRSLSVAFGAVVLVLLIACANVTNLLLARSAARRREMALRATLGATRGRLVTQLLAESLVLCAAGGAAGLMVAALLLQLARPLLNDSLPFTASAAIDGRVFSFTAATVLIVTVVVGILPALHLSPRRLTAALNDAGRGASGARRRGRRAIVIGEVALSVVLVCGAALLFRSLANLQHVETGIRVDHVITTALALPERSYPTPERAALFFDTITRRVAAVPGITRVGLTSHLPLRWIDNGEGIFIAGQPGGLNVRLKRVDSAYFDSFAIPVLSGRGLLPEDRRGAPRVAVINETAARRLASAASVANPVGRTFGIGTPAYLAKGAGPEPTTIVGIVRDERVTSPGGTMPPVVYLALAQAPRPDVYLVARTSTPPATMASGIREAVRAVDPALPLGEFVTMDAVRDEALADASRPAWLIGAFAAVAAMLAALGLYGVLAQTVADRRREIGIRLALGARPGDVMAEVCGSAIRLTTIGLATGLAAAIATTRVIKSLLFHVSPIDPAALLTACAAVGLVGLASGVIPAARAARVDPVRVLRGDG
jgi:putative ABC transport system permease protein